MTAPQQTAGCGAVSITSLTPGVFDDLAGEALDPAPAPPPPPRRRRRDIEELHAAAAPRPRLLIDDPLWASIDSFGPTAAPAPPAPPGPGFTTTRGRRP